MRVCYVCDDEIVNCRTGSTRRDALAAHGDTGGKGVDYARNPAGGCTMVALDGDRWSRHGKGPHGVWGKWIYSNPPFSGSLSGCGCSLGRPRKRSRRR